MPRGSTVYSILIASPSDVPKEREAAKDVIALWNATHSRETDVILEAVLWETHSTPELGERPQAIINKQLVSRCDALIGVFWTRLGTPTGKSASGTVEEIDEFVEAGKPVQLYFSNQPVVPGSIDQEQFAKLVDFKKTIQQKGLYEQYDSLPDFREKLNRHLSKMVADWREDVPQIRDELLLTRRPSAEANRAREMLSQSAGRLEAEWVAERDSDPHGVDDGKYVLSRAGDDLTSFLGEFGNSVDEDSRKAAQEILRDIKSIQRHQLYLDGGVSFREFWTLGDDIVNRTVRLSQAIRTPPKTKQV